MHRRLLPLLLLVIVAGCAEPVRYDLVIRDVGVFDGVDDLGVLNIGVDGDTIAAITADPLEGDSVIDGTGRYVIPGLVNAHVHVSTEEQLQEGLAHGILANLNMHTGLEDREREWKERTRSDPAFPLLFGAGHAATAPGGHPSQFSPDMETLHDTMAAEEWVARRVARGADYIKIVRESQEFMGNPALPTLTYDRIAELIEAAHDADRLAVVHTSTFEETVRISELGADGFVHMASFASDYPPSAEQLAAVRESGAFIVPTAVLVPYGNLTMDQAPPPVRQWVEENFLSQEENVDFIRRIHDAGIPIIAGTDAPNVGLNFGDHLFEELDLYRQAGMSNLEVLRTATGNAARAFDLPVGLLRAGAGAHLVLLGGSPVEDLGMLRVVEGVWKGGVRN